MTSFAIFSFFVKHIKPYKWYYMIMFLPPFCSSFYPFAHNYAIKLLLDALANLDRSLHYPQIITPIAFFLGTHVVVDIIWRIGQIASWKSLPYVRRSFLLEIYNDVQNQSYYYFQNNFTPNYYLLTALVLS